MDHMCEECAEHTLIALVVMELSALHVADVLVALEHGHQALVDADVLLFRLHHPDALCGEEFGRLVRGVFVMAVESCAFA